MDDAMKEWAGSNNRSSRGLAYVDHRRDPASWAKSLGISQEAVEVYLASDVLDLHVDSFIWKRIFGYDMGARHGKGLLGARFYRQADFPRIREACIDGAAWIITTNPARFGADTRVDVFRRNLEELKSVFASVATDFQLARTWADYQKAKGDGKHAAFIGVQGANCLDRDLDAYDVLADGTVLLVTLLHLYPSSLGSSSAPSLTRSRREEGLTDFGRDVVRRLNELKVFVDLAHVSKKGFWDAMDVHDKTQPVLVSHTGVEGAHRHWRNIDDDQLRAVANTGGLVGILYHGPFLGGNLWNWNSELIVRHLEHVVATVGEDYAALGSDWDGAVVTPRDMPTCLELPVLVERMLNRGWSPERIQKVLGGNVLRVLKALRG